MSITMSLNNLKSSTALFLLYGAVYLVAALLNHIDDTDETYGYWEPLHYLLFNKGMQTWEYAPLFSIRTYAFIYPVYLLGEGLKWLNISKVDMFRLIRTILGTFTAYTQTNFASALYISFGPVTSWLTVIFTLSSAGIFFASTSYLPSAVTMNLVTLSCSSWLRKQYSVSIMWGSFAVLWSGWPFVALLFVPLGLFMVLDTALLPTSQDSAASALGRLYAVSHLLVTGAAIALAVCVPALLLDHHFYQKWTSPSLNILLYNAIGGSGDELYGVEPVSYYVRNLALNLGVAWPLALLSPLSALTEAYMVGGPLFTRRSASSLVLHSLVAVWLGVLFTRPHKEERFIYPVYPLVAFVAASSLHAVVGVTQRALDWLTIQTKTAPNSRKQKVFSNIVFALVAAVSLSVGVSRVASNRINYKGYIQLWSDASDIIARERPLSSSSADPVRVCTGTEWYLFPSHFFLPSNAQLDFLSDGFGGILPQHFAPTNGTFCEPLQPFNDRNREEVSRYVSLSSCDYLVLLVDDNGPAGETDPLRRGLMNSGGNWEKRSGADSAASPLSGGDFSVAAQRKVISPEHSSSSLGRAFYVPGLSERTVRFRDYVLFRNNRK